MGLEWRVLYLATWKITVLPVWLSASKISFLPSVKKIILMFYTQELAEPDHTSSGPGSQAGQPTPRLRGSAENP